MGEAGYVDIGVHQDINQLANEFTVEVWVRPGETSGRQTFLSNRTFDEGPGGIRLGMDGTGLLFTAFGVKDYFSNPGVFTSLEWHHVVAVFDSDNDVSFFVNGSFFQTVAASNPANRSVKRLTFGRNAISRPPREEFWGTLDEVAIYGTSLTPERIQAHYLAAVPEPSCLCLLAIAGVGLLAVFRRRKRRTAALVAVGIVLAGVGEAKASSVVYSNDFELGVGPEWAADEISTTPTGTRRFLGRFANHTVSLNLAGLPAHTELGLSFDLFIIQSWDGNYDANPAHGPDRWALSVGGGPTLLDTTFSNDHPSSRPWGQSFPDGFPDDNLPRMGATEINSLGYEYYLDPTPTDPTGNVPMDSVYHVEYTFAHSDDSLALSFVGSNLYSLEDESWGLDNVIVSVTVVPEPGTTALLLGAAITLLAFARRRRGLLRKRLDMFRSAMIAAVGVSAVGAPVMAASVASTSYSIPIGNPSFEDPAIEDHVVQNVNVSFDIPSWSHARVEGVFNPSDAQYPGASDQEPDLDTPIPDGKNVAFIAIPGESIFQNLTEPLTGDTEYTLSAWFGDRIDTEGPTGYSMRLVAGGWIVANAAGTVSNDWIHDTATATVASDHPAIGEPLRIEIWRVAGPAQVNVDAVSLTATPIPEPGSPLLLACGVSAFSGLAWRRRRSAYPEKRR